MAKKEKQKIKKGKAFWIYPSQGFLGIETGKVVVESIVKREVALKVFDKYDLPSYDVEDEDPKYSYKPESYVVYKYEDGERVVLPLEIFQDHTEEV